MQLIMLQILFNLRESSQDDSSDFKFFLVETWILIIVSTAKKMLESLLFVLHKKVARKAIISFPMEDFLAVQIRRNFEMIVILFFCHFYRLPQL